MPFPNMLFWTFFAAYVVHIVDETLLAGGFVAWIARSFWPAYHMRMFFWFNAALLAAIATGNVLYDAFGGHWAIIPIVFIAGFATHALTLHLFWTVRQNTYSPGLLTSSLYLVVFYALARFGVGAGQVSHADFVIGTIVGVATIGVFLTIGPTVVFPRLIRGPKE